MLPSVESIECFVAGAQLLNFRAAARSVSLTPAALGKRIQQLERQLGVQLFHRTTRRVELTEAGLALVPHAQEMLRLGHDCTRAARGEVGPTPTTLSLGTRHELGLSWLVPMLDSLEVALPHLTLNLYFSSGPDLELRVRGGEIDAAVTSRRTFDPRLDFHRLHEERYAFVASPKLLKRHPFKTAKDAGRHTLIDVHAELPLFRYWRDAPRGGDRLEFGRLVVMGTIAAIRARVLSKRGVAVLPLYLVERDMEAGRLVQLFPRVKLGSDHFKLLFRKGDPRSSLLGAIAAHMLEHPLK